MTPRERSGQDDFVSIYELTLGDVYSYVLSRVRRRAVAEDITQEVFLAGANRSLSGAEVGLPWLIGVARHKVIDHWRAEQRDHEKSERAGWVAGGEPMIEPSVDPGRAADVLQLLNPTYRIALVLRHVDGLSVPEVAVHLGRTTEAAEQILSRARAAFRHEYSGGNR